MSKEVDKINKDVLDLQKICRDLKEDFEELRELVKKQFKKDEEEIKNIENEFDWR